MHVTVPTGNQPLVFVNKARPEQGGLVNIPGMAGAAGELIVNIIFSWCITTASALFTLPLRILHDT